MQQYMITPDELDSLVRFVNGEDRSAVENGTLEKWFRVTADLDRAMVKDAQAMARRAAQISDRLGRIEARNAEKLNALIAAGSFDCMGFDNVDIENAVIHFHKKKYPGSWLSRTKVMHITYMCYATVLKRYSRTLTIEKPVAAGDSKGNALGPCFWRRVGEVNPAGNPGRDVVDRIASVEPGVMKIIENVTAKYGSYSEDLLKRTLVQSAPVMAASKEHNGGKWNKEIDDRQIYLWAKSIAE